MKNNILLALLLVIFSAVLYSALAVPLYHTARDKYDRVTELQGVLSKGDELQEIRDRLQGEKNNVSPETARLIQQSIAPYSNANVVKFVIALNRFLSRSSQSGGIGGSTPYVIGGERSGAEGMVAIPFTFTFSDINYAIFRSFLSGLQRWERGVRIASVDIGAQGDDNSQSVRATVVIEALFHNNNL